MTVIPDPPAPVVTFVWADFVAEYPEFANISPPRAEVFFRRANNYFTNSALNPALCNGLAHMTSLMYMVTAHLAWLGSPKDANGFPSGSPAAPNNLVGRINSASEGSVSVGVELKGGGSPSEEFWTQTQYGFEFWAATGQYRTWIYGANPVYVPSAIYPYGLPVFGRRIR